VNCTSATSYNCDATITFFLFRYLHSTSCITYWPTWSLNAAQWSKQFHNDASTYWSKNHFPWKTRNSHGTPLHVLRSPCWRALLQKKKRLDVAINFFNDNQHVKIYHSEKFQQFARFNSNVIKFHEVKMACFRKKVAHEQKDKKCLRNTNI